MASVSALSCSRYRFPKWRERTCWQSCLLTFDGETVPGFASGIWGVFSAFWGASLVFSGSPFGLDALFSITSWVQMRKDRVGRWLGPLIAVDGCDVGGFRQGTRGRRRWNCGVRGFCRVHFAGAVEIVARKSHILFRKVDIWVRLVIRLIFIELIPGTNLSAPPGTDCFATTHCNACPRRFRAVL